VKNVNIQKTDQDLRPGPLDSDHPLSLDPDGERSFVHSSSTSFFVESGGVISIERLDYQLRIVTL
jgi:hypothetical protein